MIDNNNIKAGKYVYICKKHGDIGNYYIKFENHLNKNLNGFYCLLCIFEKLNNEIGQAELLIKEEDKKDGSQDKR